VVKVTQRVDVTVLEVDLERKRISLSMKGGAKSETKEAAKPPAAKGPQDHHRHEKPRQDRQKDKKPEPALFNNPFAKAFGQEKIGKAKK
jgi:uncharacterized protein